MPTPTKQLADLTPTILVIFGITGDLAKRYLLPSLYHLCKQNLLPTNFQIVGVSRRTVDLDDLFSNVEICVSEADKVCDPATIKNMRQLTRMHQLDMDDAGAYKSLRQLLDDIEAEQGVCLNRLYYLSIPPTAYRNVISHLGEAGLNDSCSHGQAQTRLLAEKPFGQDLQSAESLIKLTASAFREEQIYRIDHYLAKETAQNIMVFRFENPLFASIWNSQLISAVEIIASEEIGIENRVEFYEQQGALRDFVQNHLLQLLAIVAMDEPASFDADSIHAAKLALMQAIQPVDDVGIQARRGQYASYKQEVGNPKSHVETFASITVTIDSPRWHGVPVSISTGKAMAKRFTSVNVYFNQPPDDGSDDTEADDDFTDSTHHNLLQFRIQPNEGIQLNLYAKKPGYDREIEPVTMDFSYHHSFGKNAAHAEPTAYERVLIDAMRGDRTLFASSDEVLAAWRVVDPVVQAWAKGGDGLVAYNGGTTIETLIAGE